MASDITNTVTTYTELGNAVSITYYMNEIGYAMNSPKAPTFLGYTGLFIALVMSQLGAAYAIE